MKQYFTSYIYSFFFLVGIHDVYAQKNELKITPKDSINNLVLNSIPFNRFHQDEKSIYNESDSISKKLYEIGFINNYINQIKKKDSIYTAFYFLGENKKTITIYYDSNSVRINSIKSFSTDFSENYFKIDINNVSSVLNSLVNQLENNGNSFAEISLKNISIKENELFADLHINKTIRRKIDDISINGYSDFSKPFIKHNLNLKKGTVFNTDKLKFASEAIQALPFVSEIKPPEVLFTNDSTTVYLYLQKNKSNKFDGLIGFLSDENGKLNFNGYLDLLLNNVFNKGETLSVNWKSNGNDRKRFNLAVETPYIFNSPITPKASFNIYKQDSTFLNIRALVDVSYIINPQNSVSVKFQTEKSNDLINNNSQNNINEFSNLFYGISYTYKKPDPFKPFQNKFFFSINTLWGNRTLTANSKKSVQQKYELTVSYNWILNQRNSIFIENNSALFTSDELFTNEIYRIGGANSIRGFDEESIFTSSYSILNLEYQYHLASRSYIYSITDFAYIQNNIQNINTQLYSFGVGYTYNIKSGVINISYALGKTSELPFDFNNSKFHIKLVQFF
ncbi:MAG: hypothetical protein L3J14_04255 [Flavobacteriaceae bacterium]|nr:hypothetical protein [Flavobacteriaceae bacterium]